MVWEKEKLLVTINLDSSKLKEFADNFKFDTNSKKFSKQIENIVGEGRNCSLQQVIQLFSQSFKKTCSADT